jgi:hypothetical protein
VIQKSWSIFVNSLIFFCVFCLIKKYAQQGGERSNCFRAIAWIEVSTGATKFEWIFRKPAPTRANIRLLVNKFKRTGETFWQTADFWGRPRTYSASNWAKPRASFRRLSNQLDIPRTTVWRVLHFKLKKREYRLQVRDYLSNTFWNT